MIMTLSFNFFRIHFLNDFCICTLADIHIHLHFKLKMVFIYEAIFLLQMMNALMYPFVTEPLHLEYSIINFASGGSHFTFYNLTILCTVHSIIVLPSNGNLLYNSINLASYNATKSNFDVLKRFNR